MSRSKEIHVAYKLPNGVQVMISGDMKKMLSEYELEPKELWKVGSVTGKCIDYIDCRGPCIQVMAKVDLGNAVHVMANLSFADDIWCICPEGNCIGMIRFLDPGIAFKDPAIYVSFEQLAKKIPPSERKAFLSMLQEMKAER